jgi:hypothetical protein
MPKVSETFGGAYLKAKHLNGQPRVVTIESINEERVYGEDIFVVYFVGERRGLKLSKTCAQDIAKVCGDEMEDWPGRVVEIYSVELTIVDRDTRDEKAIVMIRARAPSSGAATTLAPPPKKPAPPPFDDDIPY